jgi:hypothetical protein
MAGLSDKGGFGYADRQPRVLRIAWRCVAQELWNKWNAKSILRVKRFATPELKNEERRGGNRRSERFAALNPREGECK